MDKKKVLKTLKRKCPYCNGVLELISRVKKDDGVSYSASYEECIDCDYQKKIENKHDHVEKYESGI
jgi:uncharacterized protein with PIN domain